MTETEDGRVENADAGEGSATADGAVTDMLGAGMVGADVVDAEVVNPSDLLPFIKVESWGVGLFLSIRPAKSFSEFF